MPRFSIYESIDKKLQKTGISKRQLAIAAGIPPSTLQSALSRRKGMPIETAIKVAVVLEISADEVLTWFII